MLEQILIAVLFVAALAYLGWQVRQAFAAKKGGCAKGCGTCDTTATPLPQKQNARQQVAPGR